VLLHWALLALSGPLEIRTWKPPFLTVGKGLLEPKLKHSLKHFKLQLPSSTQESYQAPRLGFCEGLIWERSNFQGASVLNVLLNLDLQSIDRRQLKHPNNTDKPSSTEACSRSKSLDAPIPTRETLLWSTCFQTPEQQEQAVVAPHGWYVPVSHTGVSKYLTGSSESTRGMGEPLPETSSAPSKHSACPSAPFSCCCSPPPPSQKKFPYYIYQRERKAAHTGVKHQFPTAQHQQMLRHFCVSEAHPPVLCQGSGMKSRQGLSGRS